MPTCRMVDDAPPAATPADVPPADVPPAPGTTGTADDLRDYDVVIVGSGFGGSVAALRLTEKGYRVVVLEAGRRFADHEFASSWHLRTFLWAPALGCYGIQRIHLLKDSLILAGAGVGGGSLVYANTLYRPLEPFFADPQWSHITDWASELAPHYDQAARMLGVAPNPTVTPADRLMLTVANRMGCADTFKLADVGVLFGAPGVDVPDPFFGGVGPARTGCTECGECMTGCRVGAKNTMTKNYLHLAERAGARVVPLTTVTELVPRAGGGWTVVSRGTGPGGRRSRTVWGADQVVVAAGTYGTQTLLHRMRASGRLPRISPRLGELTRTNSEALLGASAPRFDPARDLSRGVAISSSFYPNPTTHIEPVRYGKGSNAMALLQTVLTVGAPLSVRWRSIAAEYGRELRRRPLATVRALAPYRWSERTTIALVMQSLDNSLTTSLAGVAPKWARVLPARLRRRSRAVGGRLTSRQGRGDPNPTWIPDGHRAARLMADEIDGVPGGSWGDLLNMPMTAHFIGGCPIGVTSDDGVLDPYQRVHGYPTLHVLDGAAITANLGVNPSLTITAQAERAVSLWPNVGESDPRPAPGAGYQRLAPVRPHRPVVPRGASGELR
ncbi:FAD-dependent oxidoreductase [Pengzhenrongella phosphoraccumulans]|uniref:FAD-dependent oxidoreductase n=1 Tax=Pengzhenrongella phosphoraccumulans TaxID=3114394 RepID=UPI00388DB01B